MENLRAAATPATKVIIVDQILPLACAPERDATGAAAGADADPADTQSLVPPGSPLLPNLGKAFAGAYHFDILVSFRLRL